MSVSHDDATERYGQAALASACASISSALEGQRNVTLNNEAYGVGQLVGAGVIRPGTAKVSMLAAAVQAGMDKHEAESTIDSGLKAGAQNPRDISALGAGRRQAAPAAAAPQKTTADLARELYGASAKAAGTLVERYMREWRGINGEIPSSFRFHPGAWHRASKQKLPAMIAPILRTDDTGTRIKAVHVTYLDPETGAKAAVSPAKQMFGDVAGGAIWLGEYGDHMLCAEGIEKGLACQAATGIPCAVGMSSTLLPQIVWPRAVKRVTLCADPNGAGEAAIHKTARALEADGIELFCCYPPVHGKDWDELSPSEIEKAVSEAKAWAVPRVPVDAGERPTLQLIDGGRSDDARPAPSLDRFRPFFDGEGNSEPPPTLIKRTLRKRGVVVIGGPSQAGKSYIAVLLAACLASGSPFFGLRIQEKVGVVYAAAEGDDTIQPRLRAVKPSLGLEMGKTLPICVLQSFRMPKRGEGRADTFAPFVADVKSARAAFEARGLPAPGVLVIDTASAGIDMNDENSANDIADVIDRARALGEETGMLVIIVHHYGKDPTKKGRGSNAWFANPDQVLSVHARFDKNQVPTNERSLFLDKLRGAPPRLIANFKLEQVAIGLDSDGEDMHEAFATPRDTGETVTATDMLPPRPQTETKKQGPRDIAFDQAFAWAEKGHATPRRVRHDGPLVKMVPLKHVRDQFSIAYATGEDGKERRAGAIRKAFADVLKVVRKDPRYAFEASGNIEWVWLVDEKVARSAGAEHVEFTEDFEENQIPI